MFQVYHFGTSSLVDKISKLPTDRPTELVFAFRRNDWWSKAQKIVVDLEPPFGFQIPHGNIEESVIVSVDSMKAKQAGIMTGMKLMHIKQGGTDIFCKDLLGHEQVEQIKCLKPGVPATLTLAIYATESAEFAMKGLVGQKETDMAREALAARARAATLGASRTTISARGPGGRPRSPP